MGKKSSKIARNERFCHSAHGGRCRGRPAHHGARACCPLRRWRAQCPVASTRKGRLGTVRPIGPRRFGTGCCAATDRGAAHQGTNRMLPVVARWPALHRECSAACPRLRFLPAIGRRGLWRLASWLGLQLTILHAMARWGRVQICQHSQKLSCRHSRGYKMARAISSPDTNPSSTRCPKHQSPHAPMLKLASHRWLLPKGSVVWA